MASKSRPGNLARFLTLLAAVFGGAGIGAVAASSVAPDSHLASVASFMLLPVSFFLGLQLWLGTALVWAVSRLVRDLVRGRGLKRDALADRKPPPGSIVFVPTAAVIAGLGGLLVGTLSRQAGVLFATLCYGIVGLGYGLALWQAARRGYLPFPEEG